MGCVQSFNKEKFEFSQIASLKRKKRSGLSLIEVIISIGIFGLLSVGVFGAALQVRFLAEKNVRESVATAVAVGFLEQLIATDFPIIERRMDDRSLVFDFVSRDGQPLSSLKTLEPAGEEDWGTPIILPLVNELTDSGDSLETNFMDFWFVPMVSRSADTPNDSIDIVIRFRWILPSRGGNERFAERTIAVVRSRVPEN